MEYKPGDRRVFIIEHPFHPVGFRHYDNVYDINDSGQRCLTSGAQDLNYLHVPDDKTFPKIGEMIFCEYVADAVGYSDNMLHLWRWIKEEEQDG